MILNVTCFTLRAAYHVGGCGEGLTEQAFDREPLDRAILIIAETVIILWEQIPRQCVIRDLHSQVVINTGKINFNEHRRETDDWRAQHE